MTETQKTERPEGFVQLIPGVYMRRLVNKGDKKFSEIRFEDAEIFGSLKQMMEILLSDDFLEENAKPVVEQVVAQISDDKMKQEDGAHHILLSVDDSIIFFNILIEVDNLEKQVAEAGEPNTPDAEPAVVASAESAAARLAQESVAETSEPEDSGQDVHRAAGGPSEWGS